MSTIKHFFEDYIIVQYLITNTLEDHILSKVKLDITNIESASNLKIKGVAQLRNGDTIKYSEKKSVYAVLNKTEGKHHSHCARSLRNLHSQSLKSMWTQRMN